MTQTLTELATPIITTEIKNVDFKTVITKAIDETLSILGENVKQSFYVQLKNNFGLRKDEIYLDLDLFTQANKAIFGKSSMLLEIRIISNLHKQVDNFSFKTEKGELSLKEYAAALQTFIDMQKMIYNV
jgi:hypothetical protein